MCKSHLSAPYIIQECARGTPPDKLFTNPKNDGLALDVAVLQRRQTFLRGLAFKMAELQKLSFNVNGILDVPTVGP
jgi:hypothetical protein